MLFCILKLKIIKINVEDYLMLKILFIGLVWPEPNSSAAGWRILQLVRLFKDQYEVHFACAASKSDYSYDLVSIGVHEHSIQLNDSSFDTFIHTLAPFLQDNHNNQRHRNNFNKSYNRYLHRQI